MPPDTVVSGGIRAPQPFNPARETPSTTYR